MISFTILTSTPAILRTQLIARGILQNVAGVVPAREGFEYAPVPNPIVTTLAVGTPGQGGYVPPVMDTRLCFLVKLVRDAEADETAGEAITDAQGVERPLLLRTKLGKWVAANSVADTLISADGRSWPARKVGTNFWAVASDAFGVWQ